jgi:hypothetical protein
MGSGIVSGLSPSQSVIEVVPPSGTLGLVRTGAASCTTATATASQYLAIVYIQRLEDTGAAPSVGSGRQLRQPRGASTDDYVITGSDIGGLSLRAMLVHRGGFTQSID